MPLTRSELETVINWNMEDKDATLFTYEKRVQTRMERLGIKPDLVNSFGGKGYTFPKSMCKLPIGKRVVKAMTPEQKQAVADRLVKARADKRGQE